LRLRAGDAGAIIRQELIKPGARLFDGEMEFLMCIRHA